MLMFRCDYKLFYILVNTHLPTSNPPLDYRHVTVVFRLYELRSRKLKSTRDLVLEDARWIIFLTNRLKLLDICAPIA